MPLACTHKKDSNEKCHFLTLTCRCNFMQNLMPSNKNRSVNIFHTYAVPLLPEIEKVSTKYFILNNVHTDQDGI